MYINANSIAAETNSGTIEFKLPLSKKVDPTVRFLYFKKSINFLGMKCIPALHRMHVNCKVRSEKWLGSALNTVPFFLPPRSAVLEVLLYQYSLISEV